MMDDVLLPAVRAALKSTGLFHSGAALLAAVSGGADSVALLHALCRLREAGGYSLAACHVQHGLRGESSLEDERFVRELCDGLGVPLTVAHARLTGGMEDAGAETRARECRRRLFAERMEADGADALLTAHHRDDQAETVLMHLLRGAGADGLCGMRVSAPFGRGQIVRPFLALPKRALVDALDAEGLPHREDESNAAPVTPRNALRLMLLPQMERLFPGAGRHIAEAAQTVGLDGDCLAAQADALYHAALLNRAPLFSIEMRALRSAPEAVKRRALRRWFSEGAALSGCLPGERGLSREDTQGLSNLLDAGPGTVRNLPCGLCAEAGRRYLHLRGQDGSPLAPPPAVAPVSLEQCPAAFEFAGVSLACAFTGENCPRDARSAVLSPDILSQGPVLRLPMPGDHIHPLGAPGGKPLRRFLTDRGIDPAFRPVLPVLAVGSRILWIPALVTAEELRVNASRDGSLRLDVSGYVPYASIQP